MVNPLDVSYPNTILKESSIFACLLFLELGFDTPVHILAAIRTVL